MGNDSDEEVFYGDFMGVFFMENLVIIDIIKGLILTLCNNVIQGTANFVQNLIEFR